MISFVWSSKYPFYAGAGGSENYTAGQVRELMRRGIPTRILTIGHGENDGRDGFPDIEFKALQSKEELSALEDTLVFVTYPLDVPTRQPAYAILHCPPPNFARGDTLYRRENFRGKTLIATSKFSAQLWRNYLGGFPQQVPVVYPFAETEFAKINRPARAKNAPTKVLFAGRLTPDKGIYTLMAALHMEHLTGPDYEVTVTSAGCHADEGKIIYPMVQANPLLHVVPARKNTKEMAALMAEHDVVVMPSTNIFWQEMFGIVSVEAQHAGCRVVASRSGGLPETNLGGLLLVKPDDPKALAAGIAKAIALGPLSAAQRAAATRAFTVSESVDALLRIMNGKPSQRLRTTQLRTRAKLRPHLPVLPELPGLPALPVLPPILQSYSDRLNLKESSFALEQVASTPPAHGKSL